MDKLKLQVLLDMADRVSAPLKRIGSGARTLGRDLDEAQKALRSLERQQAAVARYRGMQEGLRETKARLDAARTAQQALVAELKKGGDAAKAVGPQYRAANDAVNKLTQAYGRQLDQTRRMRQGLAGMGITNAAADEKRLADAVDRTTKAIERKRAAQARLERLEASTKKGAAIGAGMAAAGGASIYAGRRTMEAGAAPARSFMAHEDAMLGVARQVPGARDEMGKLTAVYSAIEEQVRALSHKIPLATTAIASMFTAAARMEVPTDKLSEFVLMASEMATAFDAVPDEITESMGKVAKNFKIELTNIRGLADTINYLDDNAISKGADIIDYLNRTSGVLSTVAMSAQNAAALGSTLLTLGERAETASTATNAIMSKFAAATKGTKKFQSAMGELGLSSEAIERSMTKDATATLMQVMEAIAKAPEAKRMGIMVELVGMEHADTLAKLVDKPDELRRQLALAGSKEAAGSMAREASARNATMSAQLVMFNNRMFNLSAVVGSNLKSAFADLLTVVNPALERLTAWVQANPGLVGGVLKATIVLGALMAAMGAILVPLGLLWAKAALLRFVLVKLGMSLSVLGPVTRFAGAVLGQLARLGPVLAAAWRMALPVIFMVGRGLMVLGRFLLATPLGLALSLLATAAYMVYSRWADMKGGAIALWTDLVALKDRFFAAGADLIGGLANGVTSRLAALRDTVVGVASSVAAWFKETLGINSPSRVFIEYGGWISEGAAIGMQKGQHLAAAAAVGLAATTAAPMALAGGSALARPAGAAMAAPAAGSTYQITINAAQGMDGQAIAQAVRAEIERMEAAKRRRVNSQMSDME